MKAVENAQEKIERLEREIARLQRREEELSDFVENAAIGLHCLDQQGRILWANQAELDLLGYGREEYIGRDFSEFYVDPEAAAAILNRLIGGENLHNCEARLRRKDGRISSVLISSSVYRQNGQFVHTRCFTRDITGRKRAEDELQQASQILQAIVSASPVPIVAIGADGNITLWNPAAESLFGWHTEEVMGKPLPFIPEEKLDEHREMRARDLDGRGFAGREICRRRKDGSPVHLLVSTAATYSPGGTITGIMSVYLDITQRKLSEDELKLKAEQLARTNAELEQYAYAASHDLQEPLRMVTTFSQLLSRRYGDKLDAQGQEYIRVMENSATRMRWLIRDLLSYSRALADTDTEPETVNTAEAAAAAIANCQSAIEETQAVVTAGDLPVLPGNRDQLIELFQNLISNGIKYRRPEEPARVTIEAVREGGFWHFCVEDNGCGFSMVYAERIFGIFKRLHGREVPGTGVGLALCKRIVEQHGGRIWAESEPGSGSKFHVTLPSE